MIAPGTFAQSEVRFFRRLLERGYEPSAIYDIGAAHGTWSAAVATVFPDARYELFEPLAGRNPTYRAELARRVEEHPNFRVHGFALGDANDNADFWAMPDAVASSLLAAAAPEEQRIVVPVRRLDDVVEGLDLPHPHIIKMDVQAGEALVIRGGVRTIARADLLHVETWLRRGYGAQTPLLTELIEALRSLGFMVVHLGGFYREATQEIASVDAYFAHARLIKRFMDDPAGFPWPETLG